MPRPLKTLWYCPAKRSVTRWLVRIWIFRTVFSCSRESTAGHLDSGVPDRPQIGAARHLRSDRLPDGHLRKVVRRTAAHFTARFAPPALAGGLHERA